MILYADTSALMKLLIDEDGSEEMLQTVGVADALASVGLAYVELRAALAAALRGERIAEPRRPGTRDALEKLWDSVSEIPVDRPLLRNAGDLAERMRLRGYDAVHLAGLIRMAGTPDLAFACWDADLRRAAEELGYRVVPA